MTSVINPIQFIQPTHFQGVGKKTTVAVLGAGPAGLAAAIGALLEGNPTVIIEKRIEGATGRTNTVALNTETIELLKRGGVYQGMLKDNLIYPEQDGYCSVRIKDLEASLKKVIASLTDQPVIHYECKVKEIQEGSQTNLIIEHASGHIATIENPDFVINAEGPKSTTNELLGNRRIEVLPKLPVIAASLKDGRNIRGVFSFFAAIGKTLYYIAAAIYHYVIYLFRLIFCSESFFSPKRQVAGALMLKTPGQQYIGLGFTKEKSEKLSALNQAVNEKKAHYEKTKNTKAKQELDSAEAELRSFVNFWVNISFCAINAFALLSSLTCKRSPFSYGSWRPLDKFEVTEIGADKAKHTFYQKGNTVFLITGDALATVDPTTGLGCNTALQQAARIRTVISGRDLGENLGELLDGYKELSEVVIRNIHHDSAILRAAYRPDLV